MIFLDMIYRKNRGFMELIQFAIILITFVGLFIWNRTESRADIRHMDAKLESNRNLSMHIHKENRESMEAFQKAFMQESRDFHARLCIIEEKNKKY